MDEVAAYGALVRVIPVNVRRELVQRRLRFGRRRACAVRLPARAQQHELLPEAPSRQAVQEEVGGMVHVHELVAHRLADVVDVVLMLGARPVGSADEEDDAGRDTEQETERGTEAHRRHLHQCLILRPARKWLVLAHALHIQ